MHSAELGSQTLSFLASVFSHGTTVAEGVATRVLGDMVAKRLDSAGHGRVWDEFKRDPAKRESTEHILQEILHEDPEFQQRLADALIAAMKERSPSTEGHASIQITGSGQAQIGNRYNERARITTKNIKNAPGGALVMFGLALTIGLLILLVKGVPAVLHRLGGSDLSANSTCQDFLNSSQSAQQAIIQNLAAQYHKPDYVTPIGEPEVSYYCASNPSTTLGNFFANAQP